MRTLYRNGRVYSAADPFATALLVDDATIAWLGGADAASGIDADEVVDLQDAFVTPAFVDAHVHATSAGLALTQVDLSPATTLAQAMELVERQARAGRGRPILGSGWDETRWPERRAPMRSELDRAGYGGVVYLARVDLHSAVVSSALAASIAQLSSLPGYSEQVLQLEAHHAVRAAAQSALTTTQILEAQRATRRRAGELGIAALHEMAGPDIAGEDDLISLLKLAADEPGPEIYAYWGELLEVAKALELGAMGAGGDLFCDGSIGSHTAALTAPYADRPGTSGVLHLSTEAIERHLLLCADAGVQAGFHAIGDAAIDQVLEAARAASAKLGRRAGYGHRLEHAELINHPEQVAEAGFTASMQPAFDAAWGGVDGMYSRRLGAERAAALNPFARLAAAGVPLAFGSDAPVTAMDPWAGVRAAAFPHEASSALSPRAAFAAHTRGGWRAIGRTEEGLLRVGAPATFAVWSAGEVGVDASDERVARWSTDPRAAVPGLPDVGPGAPLPTCLRTVLRGQTIFQTSAA